jgi:uncharacterized membrane protein (DUF2068 family)
VRKRHDGAVTLIGVFKLMKAAALLALGIGAIVAMPARISAALAKAVAWSGIFAGRETVWRLIDRVQEMSPAEARRFGLVGIAYAVVFLIEGVGLLLKRRWAEWLTVFVTTSFIPFEIYELVHRPGAGKVLTLVLNAAIVVYLAHRRFEESSSLRRLFRRPPHLVVLSGMEPLRRHGALRR